MTRYDRVKKIINETPQEKRIFCQNRTGCACIGCLNSKGVRAHEYDLYLKGKL